jgi:hypothetical protein
MSRLATGSMCDTMVATVPSSTRPLKRWCPRAKLIMYTDFKHVTRYYPQPRNGRLCDRVAKTCVSERGRRHDQPAFKS